MILQFETLIDISEEETHHLHELLSLLFSCPDFFVGSEQEGDSRSNTQASKGGKDVLPDGDQDKEAIKKYVRRWTKFVKIVNILNSKLVVIVDTYVKGTPGPKPRALL